MKTRTDYLRAISDAGLDAGCSEEGKSLIEALLLFAATTAGGMSDNSVGFPEAHITESAERMYAVLTLTFGG